MYGGINPLLLNNITGREKMKRFKVCKELKTIVKSCTCDVAVLVISLLAATGIDMLLSGMDIHCGNIIAAGILIMYFFKRYI